MGSLGDQVIESTIEDASARAHNKNQGVINTHTHTNTNKFGDCPEIGWVATFHVFFGVIPYGEKNT